MLQSVVMYQEIASDTPSAIAIAIVMAGRTGNQILSQRDYQTYRYLSLIVSKIAVEYRTYEELAYDLKTNFKLTETPSLQYLMKKITSFFNCDDGDNYCREKWNCRIIPKFIRFQSHQKHLWQGQIEKYKNTFRYISIDIQSENLNLNSAVQSSVHMQSSNNVIQMTPRTEKVEEKPEEVEVVGSYNIKVDYLKYLLEKLQLKFGPASNTKLLILFSSVVEVEEGLFQLPEQALTDALITMYDSFSEDDELKLINILTHKLMN